MQPNLTPTLPSRLNRRRPSHDPPRALTKIRPKPSRPHLPRRLRKERPPSIKFNYALGIKVAEEQKDEETIAELKKSQAKASATALDNFQRALYLAGKANDKEQPNAEDLAAARYYLCFLTTIAAITKRPCWATSWLITMPTPPRSKRSPDRAGRLHSTLWRFKTIG